MAEEFFASLLVQEESLLHVGIRRDNLLWNVDIKELVRAIYGHNAIGCSVAFSADGARILPAAYDRTVWL